MSNLPIPECKYGYPETQIFKILDNDIEKLKDFFHWMRGQTYSSCDGRIFDAEANRMVNSNCGPHGWVYYSWDVQRYLDGSPIVD